MNRRFTPILLAVLCLTMISGNVFGQKKKTQNLVTVESTVVDANGTPIAGAVITGNEGAIEVVSDANGVFTIHVPGNTELLIEARGYHRQFITAFTDANIPPVRMEKALYPEEQTGLVNIPFGMVMKKDVVGAVTRA